MNLLVVHGWLRGNLGDVLQGSVLLRALRSSGAERLDLAGFPAPADEGARELVALADRHLAEPFNWFWKYLPESARIRTVEPGWHRARSRLFSRYDAVISAPGPFLADYDARCHAALADIEVAKDLGIPFVLASHSIGPLARASREKLARATLTVARERATHDYLTQHGLPSIRAADLAFLYPYEDALEQAGPSPISKPYRLLFLRAHNVRSGAVTRRGNELCCGARTVALDRDEQVVVATSDARRDRRFVRALAGRLGVRTVLCRSTAELIGLIAGSTGVISDRYHPAICAAILGKPVVLLANREPHKMLGLEDLLRENSIDDLRGLAQAGLDAVTAALHRAPAATPEPTREPAEESPR